MRKLWFLTAGLLLLAAQSASAQTATTCSQAREICEQACRNSATDLAGCLGRECAGRFATCMGMPGGRTGLKGCFYTHRNGGTYNCGKKTI